MRSLVVSIVLLALLCNQEQVPTRKQEQIQLASEIRNEIEVISRVAEEEAKIAWEEAGKTKGNDSRLLWLIYKRVTQAQMDQWLYRIELLVSTAAGRGLDHESIEELGKLRLKVEMKTWEKFKALEAEAAKLAGR